MNRFAIIFGIGALMCGLPILCMSGGKGPFDELGFIATFGAVALIIVGIVNIIREKRSYPSSPPSTTTKTKHTGSTHWDEDDDDNDDDDYLSYGDELDRARAYRDM